MCGLLGFAGDPKVLTDKGMAKAALAKTKILGLYNMDRGKHSCGIYVNNEIHKGTDKEKLFSDFIQTADLPIPWGNEFPVIIGHTRMATHGVHNYDNAHPFNVNDEFILAHNGVIRNVWSLCNKHKINHSKIHVDSLGLAHLINQEGFKILNDYEGFAALLIYKVSEPNSMYIYRGMSRRTTDGELEEERPLYYMQSEEGIYVSSMEKALLAITDGYNDKIRQVEGNIVHKITNGKMTKSKYPINRDAINIGVSINTNGGSPVTNFPKTGFGQGVNQNTSTTGATNSRVGNTHVAEPDVMAKILNMKEQFIPTIWHESLPDKAKKATTGNPIVIYHEGRFWKVDKEEISMMHGIYYINKKGRVQPFRENALNNYCFFEGILMRNEKCYKAALEDDDLTDKQYNFACNVSKYAEYPVCNTRSDVATRCHGTSQFVKIRWYHNNNMVGNYGFTPKWSERNYTIKEGLLHRIESQKGYPKEVCINMDSLQAEKDAIRLKLESERDYDPFIAEPSKGPSILLPAIIKEPQQTIIQFNMREQLEKARQELAESRGDIKTTEVNEFDVTNFYRPWGSIEEARKAFTKEELHALKYYTCDIMANEMEYVPDSIHDDCVDIQLNMFLSMCIETRTTIVDIWDESNYEDIYHYLLLARDHKDGKYSMDMDTPVDSSDACEFVPKKPEDMIDTNLYAVSADPKDDLEPPLIDSIIEDAKVPTEKGDVEMFRQVIEEFTDDDQITYAVQDIVDYSGDVRDCADELVCQDDDFSQEIANLVYRTLDPMFHKMAEICEKFGEKEHLAYLKERMQKALTL